MEPAYEYIFVFFFPTISTLGLKNDFWIYYFLITHDYVVPCNISIEEPKDMNTVYGYLPYSSNWVHFFILLFTCVC